MKRANENEPTYRMRRGKLVEIPPEWVGRDHWYTHGRRRRSDRRARLEKPLSTWGARLRRRALAPRRVAVEILGRRYGHHPIDDSE